MTLLTLVANYGGSPVAARTQSVLRTNDVFFLLEIAQVSSAPGSHQALNAVEFSFLSPANQFLAALMAPSDLSFHFVIGQILFLSLSGLVN